MGDRGNIEIVQGTKLGNNGEQRALDSVYLYTHWRGSQVCQVLAKALKEGQRWDDPSYLTRIIFNELQGTDREATGFGIGIGIPDDNEYAIPKVIWSNNEKPELRVHYNGRDFSPNEFIEEYNEDKADV